MIKMRFSGSRSSTFVSHPSGKWLKSLFPLNSTLRRRGTYNTPSSSTHISYLSWTQWKQYPLIQNTLKDLVASPQVIYPYIRDFNSPLRSLKESISYIWNTQSLSQSPSTELISWSPPVSFSHSTLEGSKRTSMKGEDLNSSTELKTPTLSFLSLLLLLQTAWKHQT